mmetsp:Transcript_124091/g.397106  ORF Transcript_124091/g.397106 Transcript_124091/m.397106 type:complete len:207 (-) Transcript_124091:1114-1734(-)
MEDAPAVLAGRRQVRAISQQGAHQLGTGSGHAQGHRNRRHTTRHSTRLLGPRPGVPADAAHLVAALRLLRGHPTHWARLDAHGIDGEKSSLPVFARHLGVPALHLALVAHLLAAALSPYLRIAPQHRQMQGHPALDVRDEGDELHEEKPQRGRELTFQRTFGSVRAQTRLLGGIHQFAQKLIGMRLAHAELPPSPAQLVAVLRLLL